mgnify:CR=1 FL=1
MTDLDKLAYDFVEEHFAEPINHYIIGAALRELLSQVYQLGRQDVYREIAAMADGLYQKEG